MTEEKERHLDKLCDTIENSLMDLQVLTDLNPVLERIAIALEKIAFEKFPYSHKLQRTYDPCSENEHGYSPNGKKNIRF